jgi:hypothetical protein
METPLKKTLVAQPAASANETELNQLLGERRAFSRMADSCSAADAECLRRMRDGKFYLSKKVAWAQFCPQYLDISKAEANRIIQRFEEFGDSYFDVSRIVRVSPESYRTIAHAVKDQTIVWNGEAIPLTSENKERVTAAVQGLRQLAALAPKPEQRAIQAGAPKTASNDPVHDRIKQLEKRAKEDIAELRVMCRSANCGYHHRQTIREIAHQLRFRTQELEAASS